MLSWGPSCQSSDNDYEVYEGSIGDFGSHMSVICSADGGTTTTITPAAGNTYYIVGPRGPTREGSYGTDSQGNERPQAIGPCSAQVVGPCG